MSIHELSFKKLQQKQQQNSVATSTIIHLTGATNRACKLAFAHFFKIQFLSINGAYW